MLGFRALNHDDPPILNPPGLADSEMVLAYPRQKR